MGTFVAHLNVTIKHLTRYKQKVVLAAMLEGKSMRFLQHGGQYKSCYFVQKSKYHKISPLNAFPLKFRVQDNFYEFCQVLATARLQSNEDMILALTGQFKQLSHEPENFR